DAQLLAQALDIGDQVPGGVVFQRGVGSRQAAAALVEHDDAVFGRVEIATHPRIDRPAGAAVEDNDRHAVRIAAFLVVDLVDAVGRHPARGVGFDLGVEVTAGRVVHGKHAGTLFCL